MLIAGLGQPLKHVQATIMVFPFKGWHQGLVLQADVAERFLGIMLNIGEPYGYGSKFRGPQVLVHVSICQGSILGTHFGYPFLTTTAIWPVFLEGTPFACLRQDPEEDRMARRRRSRRESGGSELVQRQRFLDWFGF